MDSTEMFDTSPFINHLNVSLVEAGAGYLKAELTASDDLRSVRGGRALQGDVVASLPMVSPVRRSARWSTG